MPSQCSLEAQTQETSKMPSDRCRYALCGIASPLFLLIGLVSGAIPDPGFWEAEQSDLDRLVMESAPHLRPVKHMGNTARHCNDLPGYEEETVKRMTNATVLVLDEELLCADFPETCDLPTRAEKDAWVLERAAWFSAVHANAIASPQADEEDEKYDIPLGDETKTARRACMGGRALLLPAATSSRDSGDSGRGPEWFDVKGVGALHPRMKSIARNVEHDGLLALFDALAEYANEKTVSSVLADHEGRNPGSKNEHFRAVGVYAVLSLGFQFPMETHRNGEIVHYVAGAVVRQASRRHPNPYGWMSPKEAVVMEQILNAYGVRSDGSQNDRHFEKILPNPHCRRINLQGTMMPQTMTDFGPIQGDPKEWPPLEDDCIVHWGQTAIRLDMPLWRRARQQKRDGNTDDMMGSRRVRDFHREELQNLGRDPTRLGVYPARATNNPRIERMLEVERCWWKGSCDVRVVEEAIRKGSIGALLLKDREDKMRSTETKSPGCEVQSEL